MKILITGANGFIGSNLTSKLQQHHLVVGQGRTKNKESKSMSFFEIDIDNQSNWQECLQDVGTIVHLASVAHNNSTDPDYINEVNVKGTINLAEQAISCGVKRFIFISSIGVLGNNTSKAFDEKSEVSPHSDYAKSKAQAEKTLLKLAQGTDLELVIIRPVLVYGIGAPGNFGKLVDLVRKTPLLPFALCRNQRSFISVENLVDFIATCIEHPKAKNEIFCISDGHDVSITDFTNGIAQALRKNLIQIPIPMFIFKLLGKVTGKSEQFNQLVGDLQVDSSKARNLLDWNPPESMTETLSKLTKTQ